MLICIMTMTMSKTMTKNKIQNRSFSVVLLKGKHCWKPHCCNGVVDTFRHCIISQSSDWHDNHLILVQHFVKKTTTFLYCTLLVFIIFCPVDSLLLIRPNRKLVNSKFVQNQSKDKDFGKIFDYNRFNKFSQ